MKSKMILAVAALLAASLSPGRERERPTPSGPQFKYVGGTEKLVPHCEGNLELGSTALTFRCPEGSITILYDSISQMQYRPDVSKKIWKMKLKWKMRPDVDSPIVSSKHNRYFTVLYGTKAATQAMVLDVTPEAMRPYLAEIDLKAGKRVEVRSFEDYD